MRLGSNLGMRPGSNLGMRPGSNLGMRLSSGMGMRPIIFPLSTIQSVVKNELVYTHSVDSSVVIRSRLVYPHPHTHLLVPSVDILDGSHNL